MVPAGLALIALGGFGRKWLFPHSDIDLLFLHANERAEGEFKDRLRQFSQEIWDLRMKLSPATRKLSECDRFDPENLEFTVCAARQPLPRRRSGAFRATPGRRHSETARARRQGFLATPRRPDPYPPREI